MYKSPADNRQYARTDVPVAAVNGADTVRVSGPVPVAAVTSRLCEVFWIMHPMIVEMVAPPRAEQVRLVPVETEVHVKVYA